MTSPHDLAAEWKQRARAAGAALAGIAPATSPVGLPKFEAWLDAGHHAGMNYLPNRRAAYQHPSHVQAAARSMLVCGWNYHAATSQSAGANAGRVASYACSNDDYHNRLRSALQPVAQWLRDQSPGARTRIVIDTAPLLERDFARVAGLGWFGKNTMLINKRQGSWFLIAVILTDVELPPDDVHHTSHCGTCTRCLDACPTNAFPEPGVLDARRCISYWTIEHRGSIPLEIRDGLGEWLFGCDICQDVCPWNRKAPVVEVPSVDAHAVSDGSLDLLDLLQRTDEELAARFADTPLARPGWNGLRRNALVVLGNVGTLAAIPVVQRYVASTDAMLAESALWSVASIQRRFPDHAQAKCDR